MEQSQAFTFKMKLFLHTTFYNLSTLGDIVLHTPNLTPVFNSHSTPLLSTCLSNPGVVCGILGKLTLLFALTLKAPESQHGPYRGLLQKGTNYGDLKA